MFRAQQNPFDDVIAKATDENLTSENWEYMMDAWEKINESGENGPRDAAAALIKRLAHRNANVQLYTLELAFAFSQNCGPKMHRELASRSFTEALLRLAGDRNTHQAVKSKILEKMAEWSDMFSKDPDLGIMEGAYHTLKSQNPSLQPPSKPHKQEITDADRLKEEEELQMALAISLKDKGPSRTTNQQAGSSSQSQVQVQEQPKAQPTPPPPQTTAATVSRVRALYDFVPTEAGELAFKKGDVIAVLESVYKDWWKGSLRGQVGIFPLNYVEKLSDPTPEELKRDAEMEVEVFAQIKNVEKLLALLSTTGPETNVQDGEEITALYHSTLAIRPKLIELIGRYSQKKDEFVALNEKFIKARRDYEALLESSMAQPPVGHYARPPVSQTPYSYGEGYAPPGGKPQNYYAPDTATSPHLPQGPYQPPSAKPVSLPYPSQPTPGPNRRRSSQLYQNNGNQAYANIPDGPPDHQNAPFYVVGHNGHPHTQQQQSDYPSAPYTPGNISHHRPASVSFHENSDPYAPAAELATSVYDSPLNDRPPQGSQFNSQAPPPSSSSRIPDAGRVSPSQPPYVSTSSGYYLYQGGSSGTAPQLSTSNIPTSLQPASNDITPVSPPNSHPYPAMPYPSSAGYGGYGPPPSHPAPAPPGQQSGRPTDYHRPSNNELFLPQ